MEKKYCQDCGCCPGPFSDCYVTFINLHDLSFSISQIFLAIVNIVDHQIGKRNLIFNIIDKHCQRHNGPKGRLLSLKLQFFKSNHKLIIMKTQFEMTNYFLSSNICVLEDLVLLVPKILEV